MGVNVASGQITGTTTAMQYSLDSTNGVNGTWQDAFATNTAVTFTASSVYVRQKAIPTNFRLVATIAAEATAPTGIGINVVAGQITGTKATQQYSLDGGTTWDDATETNTPVTFAAGNSVVVREKATASALASASTTPITVTAATAPTGIGINVAAGQITGTTATQQYSLDGGANWSNASAGNTAVTFAAGNLVVVREKAIASALASASTTPSPVTAASTPTVAIAKGNNGSTIKLTGLTNGVTYEYVVDSNATLAGDAAEWSGVKTVTLSGTVIENIQVIPGQYIHLRVKATIGKLASDVQNSNQMQSGDITSYEEAVEKDRERLTAPFPIADSGAFMSIPGPAYGSNITWVQGSSTGGASATFDVGRGTFQVHGNSGSTVTIVATITQGTATATKDIVITIK